jgi:hypothetical protein
VNHFTKRYSTKLIAIKVITIPAEKYNNADVLWLENILSITHLCFLFSFKIALQMLPGKDKIQGRKYFVFL